MLLLYEELKRKHVQKLDQIYSEGLGLFFVYLDETATCPALNLFVKFFLQFLVRNCECIAKLFGIVEESLAVHGIDLGRKKRQLLIEQTLAPGLEIPSFLPQVIIDF